MTVQEEIDALSRNIVEYCAKNNKKIATAESCTGGLISAAITSISGSSSAIELGICSYSNRIKTKVLGVSEKILAEKSEYSIECAMAMAKGARELANADFAVSTTGVAGPCGGSEEHPVGEVFVGICGEKGCSAERFVFKTSDAADARADIRAQAAKAALLALAEMLQQ